MRNVLSQPPKESSARWWSGCLSVVLFVVIVSWLIYEALKIHG